MNNAIRQGLSFGLTSGIITTLGLLIGLNFSTNSKLVVMSGVIVIAIADALSDSFGMHISEESVRTKQKKIWQATSATFLSKFILGISFLIPILLFNLTTAVYISIAWAILLLTIISYHLAKREKINPLKVILEHLTIAIIVIIISAYIGNLTSHL
ncbi:hypothetical protein J4438_00730 [Candidatus Woesearchaeota archaeon]|nr:hypothetical protein [Candidatus Woesearchaeota archaeon]